MGEFPMKKLTKEKVEEIRNMYNNGMTQLEISQSMGVSQRTIGYWLSTDEKRLKFKKHVAKMFKSKPMDEKREIYRRRLPYIREYLKRKYSDNEIFREKEKERARKYRIIKKNKIISYNSS